MKVKQHTTKKLVIIQRNLLVGLLMAIMGVGIMALLLPNVLAGETGALAGVVVGGVFALASVPMLLRADRIVFDGAAQEVTASIIGLSPKETLRLPFSSVEHPSLRKNLRNGNKPVYVLTLKLTKDAGGNDRAIGRSTPHYPTATQTLDTIEAWMKTNRA